MDWHENVSIRPILFILRSAIRMPIENGSRCGRPGARQPGHAKRCAGFSYFRRQHGLDFREGIKPDDQHPCFLAVLQPAVDLFLDVHSRNHAIETHVVAPWIFAQGEERGAWHILYGSGSALRRRPCTKRPSKQCVSIAWLRHRQAADFTFGSFIHNFYGRI